MPKLVELAALVGGEIIGDGEIEISGATGLEDLRAGMITLGATQKAVETALKSPVAAVIVPDHIHELAKPGIGVANPRFSFARILTYFAPRVTCCPGIHPAAVVGDNFKDYGCQVGPLVYIGNDVAIGKGTIIHPGAVIGDRVTIGEDSVIHANVVIREGCRIGSRVQIHDGTVIGADGFGYTTVDGQHYKLPQTGIVVIEDEVEIGAITAIDRATTHVTLIKQGTKIDNLVQIGHNCLIGPNNIICGQTGLAGSTITGDRVTMAARSGAIGHLEIGPDSVLAACSKVIEDLPPKSFFAGDPARPYPKQMRIQASLSRLPELVKEVRELRKMVMELKEEQKKN